MKKIILVLTPINVQHKQIIQAAVSDAEIIYADPDDDTLAPDLVQAAHVIFGNPPIGMVKESKSLEWLQLNSAGVGAYAKKSSVPENVILTNASGAYGLGIAEHMLGLLLTIYKKLHLYRDHQAKGQWLYEGQVKSVYGSVALIVGLGDIGGEFASRLKLLGAYTIAVRRTSRTKPDFIDEIYTMDQLGELLPRADIVALSLPSTPQTRRIIDAKALGLMKKDAVLINVGRGDCLDTEALCDALASGHMLGVALDVTDPEPLPPEHRLWKIKNAVLTPHVSGGYSLPLTHDRIVGIFLENLKAYYGLQPYRHVVDRQAGY